MSGFAVGIGTFAATLAGIAVTLEQLARSLYAHTSCEVLDAWRADHPDVENGTYADVARHMARALFDEEI